MITYKTNTKSISKYHKKYTRIKKISGHLERQAPIYTFVSSALGAIGGAVVGSYIPIEIQLFPELFCSAVGCVSFASVGFGLQDLSIDMKGELGRLEKKIKIFL